MNSGGRDGCLVVCIHGTALQKYIHANEPVYTMHTCDMEKRQEIFVRNILIAQYGHNGGGRSYFTTSAKRPWRYGKGQYAPVLQSGRR